MRDFAFFAPLLVAFGLPSDVEIDEFSEEVSSEELNWAFRCAFFLFDFVDSWVFTILCMGGFQMMVPFAVLGQWVLDSQIFGNSNFSIYFL